ncbi:hypothetical protein HUN92_13525 [Bacillus firmus]|uniref:hypothetical protein n=1 Tax=Cytobacillus firmus TaxID=1399 RepID=UPI00158033F2|nr:hypothetical protein [Cytobacillus firmus]NUH84740.1 hypothetical protein [Cytobacillus firmus]
MARKTKIEKINTLEEQIKELEQKKKEMLEKLYIEVGKHVVNEWDCNDDKVLKKLVDHFKEDAQKLLDSEDDETLNGNEGSGDEGQKQLQY